MAVTRQTLSKMTDDLHEGCAVLLRNATITAALRAAGADLFIGDPMNKCCWLVADLLR